MPSIELSRYIGKPVDLVYDLICDLENYPKYMKNIVSIQVLERSNQMAVTLWVVEVDGVRLTWQETDVFFPEEWTIRYRLTKGDMARYEGEWSLKPSIGGTILNYKVDFELGIPMISGLLQYLLVKKVENSCRDMLNGIKEIAEKDNMPFYKSTT